jgi:hypothetical protein
VNAASSEHVPSHDPLMLRSVMRLVHADEADDEEADDEEADGK